MSTTQIDNKTPTTTTKVLRISKKSCKSIAENRECEHHKKGNCKFAHPEASVAQPSETAAQPSETAAQPSETAAQPSEAAAQASKPKAVKVLPTYKQGLRAFQEQFVKQACGNDTKVQAALDKFTQDKSFKGVIKKVHTSKNHTITTSEKKEHTFSRERCAETPELKKQIVAHFRTLFPGLWITFSKSKGEDDEYYIVYGAPFIAKAKHVPETKTE